MLPTKVASNKPNISKMSVNKSQFTEELAANVGITVSKAEHIVNTIIRMIYETLAAGGIVNLSGFGQFRISHRKARIGINPRTRAKITIPELNTPKFKAGEGFKQAVRLHP